MIDMDLVNVDFDISKDKEHTTKYLNDLNQQTPFQVLDNTYTEHLRAVLNYGPILTVREPFTGCEPVITDSRWEGTYLYFTMVYSSEYFNSSGGEGIPYINATDQPNNMGSVVETVTPEGGGYLIVKSIAMYSYPSVKEFTTYAQVSNEDLLILTHLETDFTKEGKPLTIEDLATRQDLTFVSGSIDNHIRFWVNQPADRKFAHGFNEILTYGNVPNPVNTLTTAKGESTIEGIRVDDPEFNTKLPMLNVTLKKMMLYYPVIQEVSAYEVTASNQVIEPYKITIEPFTFIADNPSLTGGEDEVYILRNVV